MEIVTFSAVHHPVRDPDNLPILGTALAGHATHLVTGDRDLLEDEPPVTWIRGQGVEVVAPAGFRV